jgi:hypothetical protein
MGWAIDSCLEQARPDLEDAIDLTETTLNDERSIVGNLCIQLFKMLGLDKELTDWLGNVFSGS